MSFPGERMFLCNLLADSFLDQLRHQSSQRAAELGDLAHRARDRQVRRPVDWTGAGVGRGTSPPEGCRETFVRRENSSFMKGQPMTAAGTQLSSFLTNRIQRIEVSS